MSYSRMTKLEGKPDTYRGDIPLRNPFALRLSTEGKPDTYRGDIPLRNPMVSPCGERANG